ncbi:hypothetical protein [Thalassovita aquimarina]|uniref:Uncharacterized protein n=1 Tax=Thalassovita aquimarina TaxID=2785917 RepID=A0ABS5HQI8_9RHOB|nr:hypothetical protein [Thalassovita aquimarina]MBR9651225.1 hypothetical protein [Thalassovita aquimarina]
MIIPMRAAHHRHRAAGIIARVAIAVFETRIALDRTPGHQQSGTTDAAFAALPADTVGDPTIRLGGAVMIDKALLP